MSKNILSDKILIIDSNIDYCKYIQELLKKHGILVYISTSCDEAINIAQDKIPDCILIDYMLPFAGATQFTQKIKEDNLLKNTSVIYLTNNDSKKACINALDVGGDDFILKTTDKDIIIARVKAFLRQKRLLENNALYLNMLKQDIESASKLQKTILSYGNSDIPRNDISTYHYAPNEVSGDYSGIKHTQGEWYAILLADVSGHGVAASMLTILIKSFFDSNSVEECKNVMPAEFIKKLNLFFIEEKFDRGLFATILYSIYNNKTGEFICSSAGNPEPVFYSHSENKVEKIDIKGPLIGITEDSQYSNYSINLKRNDMIFMFTDGAYEVFDDKDEMFGEDKLIALFTTLTNKDINAIPTTIVSNLKKYSENNALQDDISMITLRRTE